MKLFSCTLAFIAIISSTVLNAQSDILDARTNYSIGQTVTVTGIITSGADLGSFRYVQDASAGIALYPGNDWTDWSAEPNPGDEVTVTGEITEYNGLLEIGPNLIQVDVLSSGNPIPDALVITPNQLNESLEGQLVVIEGTTFDAGGQTIESNATYTFTSSGEEGVIYVRSSNSLVGTTLNECEMNLMGIVSQYSFDGYGGYQLLPRGAADMEMLCEGCTTPFACNYDPEATIDDGSCEYPEEFYDCDGICIDPSACNYLVVPDIYLDSELIYEEKFDSFAPGLYISNVSPYWLTWSGSSDDDAEIFGYFGHESDQSLQFNNDLVVSDVSLITNVDFGQWRYTHWMFVPYATAAYYNFQESASLGQGWAFDTYFNSNGTFNFSVDATNMIEGEYNQGVWLKIDHLINLDTDEIFILINGNLKGSFIFDSSFGAVNYYNGTDLGSNYNFYIDDISLSTVDASMPEAIENPCVYPEEFLDCDGNCIIGLESFEIIGSVLPEELTLSTYSVSPYLENNLYTWSVNGGVELSSGDGLANLLFASFGIGSVHCEQSQGTCNNSSDLTVVILPSGTIIPVNGCTYPDAINFDSLATADDGSCVYEIIDNFCPADLNYNGTVGTPDLLLFLSAYGNVCG
jgi:hypothetical protein